MCCSAERVLEYVFVLVTVQSLRYLYHRQLNKIRHWILYNKEFDKELQRRQHSPYMIDYMLEDRSTLARFVAEAIDVYELRNVQAGLGAQPAS